MQDSTIKGAITELNCVKAFLKRNILVSQPVVADSKYDYIVDFNGRLLRIQCKTATLSENKDYLTIKTKTTNIRTMKDTYYSKEDIDYFYTYCDGKDYLIPVEKSGHGVTCLRFTSKCANPNIRWAIDYELDKILSKIEEVSK